MALSNTLRLVITADTVGLSREMEKATASTSRFGKSSSKLGGILHGALSGAAGVAGAAIVGLGYGLDLSLHAALDNQVAQHNLAQALKDAGIEGKRALGWVEAWSTQASLASGFTKDDLTVAVAQLATTTGHVTSALKLENDAMNLARARNLSLAQASTILSKVWNGNTTSLVRLGIYLPKVTKAQDTLKAATGTATAAQVHAAKAADLVATRQAALAALQKKYGGQWKAYGDTGQGSMDRLHAAIHEVFVVVGTALIPVVTRIADHFAKWISKTKNQQALLHTVKTVAHDATIVFQTMANIVEGLATAVGKLNDSLSRFGGLKNVLLQGLGTGLPGFGKLPFMASGGVVTRPTLAMIGESGPEAVVPLNQAGDLGGAHLHFHAGVIVSEVQLAQLVERAMAKYARQGGMGLGLRRQFAAGAMVG